MVTLVRSVLLSTLRRRSISQNPATDAILGSKETTATTEAPQPSLRQRLQQDMLAALKTGNGARAGVLKQLCAELLKGEKAASPDVDEIGILQRCRQRWGMAIQEYERLAAGSAETAMKEKLLAAREKEMAELTVIESYLPPAYTPEEVEAAVRAVIPQIKDLPANSRLGTAMKLLLRQLESSRLDKRKLSAVVSKCLASLSS